MEDLNQKVISGLAATMAMIVDLQSAIRAQNDVLLILASKHPDPEITVESVQELIRQQIAKYRSEAQISIENKDPWLAALISSFDPPDSDPKEPDTTDSSPQ